MKQVLFLCSGNYYRSRYAEELFNALARQRGLKWRAESCGLQLSAGNVGPISCHTTSALARAGIAGNEWRLPRTVTEADLQAAHIIVAVKEHEHRAMLVRSFPNHLERVEFWHVHDLDCAAPEETIADLERRVLELIERLTTPAATGGITATATAAETEPCRVAGR